MILNLTQLAKDGTTIKKKQQTLRPEQVVDEDCA